MAGKYGIKVLCVEGQAPTLKTHGEMVDRLDESNAAVAKRAAELTGIGQSLGSFAKEKISDWTNGKIAAEAKTERGVLSLSNYMKATDPQTISIKQQDKRVLEARAAGDVGLAKMITDQVKGEKTAVFYGTGHGAQNYDLDEILNARKINLHSDMNDVRLMNQSDFMRNNQSADFSIAINTGQTVTRQEADRMLIKSEPQLQKDFLPTTQKP
ncbi:MAG: hypothetical protein JWO78_1005 [Micavibrio sp.]|nr:hypothetical protein [Micavibrio sp.]